MNQTQLALTVLRLAAGATFMAHGYQNGFFPPTGVEFVMLLMVSAIALALAGPGAYSIDGLFDSTSRRPK